MLKFKEYYKNDCTTEVINRMKTTIKIKIKYNPLMTRFVFTYKNHIKPYMVKTIISYFINQGFNVAYTRRPLKITIFFK